MDFLPENIYHIYNRGNNRQVVFFKRDNYLYFLDKLKKYVCPHCELLAYCLMPNHFHLLVYTDERILKPLRKTLMAKNELSEGLRLLLSSYTKGINVQENRVGSLFQQKTKAKCVSSDPIESYADTCFHYIHQNPLLAGLVDRMEDWEFSSFGNYAGVRNGELVNHLLASKLFDIDSAAFQAHSTHPVPKDHVSEYF